MYEDLFGLITSNIDRLSRFPASAALFLSPDASTPRVAVGQYFTNPDLAETFRAIAANGSSEPFYLGSIGEDIVSTVHSASPIQYPLSSCISFASPFLLCTPWLPSSSSFPLLSPPPLSAFAFSSPLPFFPFLSSRLV